MLLYSTILLQRCSTKIMYSVNSCIRTKSVHPCFWLYCTLGIGSDCKAQKDPSDVCIRLHNQKVILGWINTPSN